MSKKKNKNPIGDRFVPIPHGMIKSKAFKELSGNAYKCLTCILMDRKNGHGQPILTLTYKQAVALGVCDSPTTFTKLKKEIVALGILDQIDSGGLNVSTTFTTSTRWKDYGTENFKQQDYIKGISSQYFKTAMKDEKLKSKILKSRGYDA